MLRTWVFLFVQSNIIFLFFLKAARLTDTLKRYRQMKKYDTPNQDVIKFTYICSL